MICLNFVLLRQKSNTTLKMARLARTQKHRYQDPVKGRGPDKKNKVRKPRARETAPRKPRQTKALPIPAEGDIKNLAQFRGRLSKPLVRKRLVAVDNKKLEKYAKLAKVSVRTARRDRGPKAHVRWLDEDQKKFVLKEWGALIKKEKSKATIAKLMRRLASGKPPICMTFSPLQRLVSIKKKPRAPRIARHNDPSFQARNHNRV